MSTVEELEARLLETELDNNRLRHRLAALDASYDRPASKVTPTGDSREGWLKTRLRGGAGGKARDAGYGILATHDADDPVRAVLVEALHDLVDEIYRWKTAWSATYVDMDHKVREAMQRSASCEHHGEEITDLNASVHRLDAERDRVESQRVALVMLLHALRQFTQGARERQARGGPLPDSEMVITELEKVITKASAAHDRAGKRTPKKATGQGGS